VKKKSIGCFIHSMIRLSNGTGETVVGLFEEQAPGAPGMYYWCIQQGIYLYDINEEAPFIPYLAMKCKVSRVSSWNPVTAGCLVHTSYSDIKNRSGLCAIDPAYPEDRIAI